MLVLAGHPVLAQTRESEGLDWRYRPEAHQAAVWDIPPEAAAEAEPEWDTPAPVILPQPEFPEAEDSGPIRGWQWKRPSIGTGGEVASYQEERTAVRIAETRQQEQQAEALEPAPGVDALPGPLGDFNYRIDFGVEYRF